MTNYIECENIVYYYRNNSKDTTITEIDILKTLDAQGIIDYIYLL